MRRRGTITLAAAAEAAPANGGSRPPLARVCVWRRGAAGHRPVWSFQL